MTHPRIPKAASEIETLSAFLDYNRAVMLDKASGLTQEQLGLRLDPPERKTRNCFFLETNNIQRVEMLSEVGFSIVMPTTLRLL